MLRRVPRLLPIALTAALVLTGACGDDDDGEDATSGATTTSTTADDDHDGGHDATTSTTAAGGGSTTTVVGSGGATTTATPAGGEGQNVIEIAIVGGNVEGGVRRETVKQGAQVTLRATSDVADELHLHTYDVRIDLVPGQSADLTFLAKVPGVFEVELEGRRKKVLELEVRP